MTTNTRPVSLGLSKTAPFRSVPNAERAPGLGHRRRAPLLPCRATLSEQLQTAQNGFLMALMENLFKFQPLYQRATAMARQKIVDRSQQIGLDFESEVAALRDGGADWGARLEAAADPALMAELPAYYRDASFHAYPVGPGWQAALEFETASRAVHAAVLDPDGKVQDPAGDESFRGAFWTCALDMMSAGGARQVERALDLGCASGLSTRHLCAAFPEAAAVTGIDLSPHMVAVARYYEETREAAGGPIRHFIHGSAEATPLPSQSVDLVSMCLLAHELPASATAACVAEAARVLRPGGTLAIMEMDPKSAIWKRIFKNPMAFAAFKSTEPWLVEYMNLDLDQAIAAAGFLQPQVQQNSPRHKTVVAIKPST